MNLQIPALQWSERTEKDGELVLGGLLRSQMGGWDTTLYPAQSRPNLRCFLIYNHGLYMLPGGYLAPERVGSFFIDVVISLQ